MAHVAKAGEIIKPSLTSDEGIRWIETLYGLKTTRLQALNGYDDQNFLFLAHRIEDNPHLDVLWPHGYVLKVTNSRESLDVDFFEAQSDLMFHLSGSGLEVPIPIPNRSGRLQSLETMDGTGALDQQGPVKFMVRILQFVPGRILNDISPWTSRHFHQCGRFIARLGQTLSSFHRPAYEKRNLIWHMPNLANLKGVLYVIKDPVRQDLLAEIIDTFTREVLPVIGGLKQGIIHGDLNEHNILLKPRVSAMGHKVFTVIDFGDSQLNPLVFDLAIAIMHMMLKSTLVHPNQTGGHVTSGYETVRPLPDLEWRALRTCVAARFAQILILGAVSHAQDPDNDYVVASAPVAWKIIGEFWKQPKEELYDQWTAIARPHQR